jgi:cytochrome c oxidase cbb3-type subunit II
MKNGFVFFLGLFIALAVSWASLVLGAHGQLGSLTPYFDETEGAAYPSRASGLAARGHLVYAELGCAACHTQQVRRPDFGSDQARGWGERQSVARDYIFQSRPQLGHSRIGPDLANLAGRKQNAPTDEGLYRLLYNGSATHPRYAFLFEERVVAGERSMRSLKLASGQPADHEIVPTEKAQALVAYLLSLNNAYVYPEARPLPPEATKGHGEKKADAGPVPEKHPVTPIPTAAPDEKKQPEGKK